MKMLCHFTSDDVACVTAAMKVKNKKAYFNYKLDSETRPVIPKLGEE